MLNLVSWWRSKVPEAATNNLSYAGEQEYFDRLFQEASLFYEINNDEPQGKFNSGALKIAKFDDTP